jgi:hypothetical protein
LDRLVLSLIHARTGDLHEAHGKWKLELFLKLSKENIHVEIRDVPEAEARQALGVINDARASETSHEP